MFKKAVFLIVFILTLINCSGKELDLRLFVSRNYHVDQGFNYQTLPRNNSEYFKKWKESEISETIWIKCEKGECVLNEEIKNVSSGKKKEKEIMRKKLTSSEVKKIEENIKKIKDHEKKVKDEEKRIEESEVKGKEKTVKYKFCKYKNNTHIGINPKVVDVRQVTGSTVGETSDTGSITCVTDELLEIFNIFGYNHEMLRKPGEIKEQDYKNFTYSESLMTNGNEREWTLICRNLECMIMFDSRNRSIEFEPLKITLTQERKKEVVERIFKGMAWVSTGHLIADYYPSSSFHLNDGRTYYYRWLKDENKDFYKVLDELLGMDHKLVEQGDYSLFYKK